MGLKVQRPQLLVAALFILVLAAYEFDTANQSASNQSTFNIQPGMYVEIAATRSASDTISGHFQVTTGDPINFYILTSAQYATFQNSGPGSLSGTAWIGVERNASTFSYTFPAQDTYYLVFTHGSGLNGTTQTVYFQRTYARIDYLKLTLGGIFLVFVGTDLYFAFRARKVKSPPSSPQPTVTPPGTDK